MPHDVIRMESRRLYGLLRWCSIAYALLFVNEGCGETIVSTKRLQRSVFGRNLENVPEYSIFEPQLTWDEDEGRTRSTHRQRRSVGARVPRLQFQALGRSFDFRLSPNSLLTSPSFVFLARRDNETQIRPVRKDQLSCYYQGVDDAGVEATSIAVELCGPVRGVVTSPSAEFVIEPIPASLREEGRHRRSLTEEEVAEDESEGETITHNSHVIYRKRDNGGVTVESRPSRIQRSFLTDQDEIREALSSREGRKPYFDSYEHVLDSRLRTEWPDHNFGGREGEGGEDNARQRSRGEDLFMEMAVFVDLDLYRHMEDNFPTNTEEQVLRVVLAMVNAVQLLYNDESLGHRVKFVLKRLEILYVDPPDLRRPYDIDSFLTNFCTWQRKENPSRDSDPLHWDHAVILTGLDVYTITSRGKVNSQVVGLAPVSGMCTRSSSCTVNEGRHFESVYVVAHEIGHNLGMRHDGYQAGNNCDASRYLMSPTLGSGKITWSPCSRRYLEVFLRSRQSECLRDSARPDGEALDHEANSLPGQRFSADQQCMLKHGVGSHHADSQPLEDICQDLHCRRNHYTWTSHPALEGTTCGYGKWCRRGLCEEDAAAPTFQQSSLQSSSSSATSLGDSSGTGDAGGGVGGEWGTWSTCRSHCLYGVDGILSSGSTGLSLSERRCSGCRGEYRYRVCSPVAQCISGQRKTLQDHSDAICTQRSRNMVLLTGLGARVPEGGLKQCEVECQTKGGGVQGVRHSFPDGTVCQSPSRLPAYCVAGVCTEFRCEPNTLYGADPVTCRPDMGAPDPHRPLGPSNNHHHHTSLRPSSSSSSSSISSSSSSNVPHPFPSSSSSSSSSSFPSFSSSSSSSSSPSSSSSSSFGNPEWGPWRAASTCRFSCLTSALGIQLVSRECRGRGCTGINKNIRICTPQNLDCDKVKSPFEYASEVCAKYKHDVDQLSGIGMQLSSTKDDPDRACTVACQDAALNYRFYRVNGRDGWFPFGTDCARGEGSRSAYCLNGKCLDFSNEGTPLRNTIYTEYERGRSLGLQPIERNFPLEVRPPPNPWRRRRSSSNSSWKRRRDVVSASHPISSTISDQFLLSIVNELNNSMVLTPRRVASTPSSIDLRNPLFSNEVTGNFTVTLRPNTFMVKPLNPSPLNATTFDEEVRSVKEEFEWRVTVSPCSVSCGEGLEEVVVTCVRVSDRRVIETVEGSYCGTGASSNLPTRPGYRECQPRRPPCPPGDRKDSPSIIHRWIWNILEDVQRDRF